MAASLRPELNLAELLIVAFQTYHYVRVGVTPALRRPDQLHPPKVLKISSSTTRVERLYGFIEQHPHQLPGVAHAHEVRHLVPETV